MNKREKIALGLGIAGIVLFFVENTYFGWHSKSTSTLEGIADFLVWALWILGYFIRPTRIEIHKRVINTKNVEIIKPTVSMEDGGE